MDARTEGMEKRNAMGKSVKGRKDKDGTDAVIKTKPLKASIRELGTLKAKADEAKNKLNDAIKAVAEKSGLLSSVVRKFVNACSGDRGHFDDEVRKVEQLSIAFEEVGYEGEITKATTPAPGSETPQ